ncbi:unnamed protein product [Ectocarpus fasciculatus]
MDKGDVFLVVVDRGSKGGKGATLGNWLGTVVHFAVVFTCICVERWLAFMLSKKGAHETPAYQPVRVTNPAACSISRSHPKTPRNTRVFGEGSRGCACLTRHFCHGYCCCWSR